MTELTPICFVTTHTAGAQHFSEMAQEINKERHVSLYAFGDAAKVIKGTKVREYTFVGSKEDVLAQLAQKVHNAIVITDISALSMEAMQAVDKTNKKWLYYDNFMDCVPGRYSEKFAQMEGKFDMILLANEKLEKADLYRVPGEKIISSVPRKGIGFYPMKAVNEVNEARKSKLKENRAGLFERLELEDTGQRILTICEGNNDVYFKSDLPMLLESLSGALSESYENTIFLYQQHPGAKTLNKDIALIQQAQKIPKIHQVEEYSTMDALKVSDGVLYGQTSMTRLFAFTKIEAYQFGLEFRDDLAKNKLLQTDLTKFIRGEVVPRFGDHFRVQHVLGTNSGWSLTLENIILEQEVKWATSRIGRNSRVENFAMASTAVLTCAFIVYVIFKEYRKKRQAQ